jgi:hypothetical protein
VTYLTPRDQAELEWRGLAPLIAQAPVFRESPDGGRSFGKWSGSRCNERKITAKLPLKPAAVRTYSDDGTGRLLVCDFDVGKAKAANVADPVACVAAEAATFDALIRRLGGRAITDVGPTGGRHVYVLLARPQRFEDIAATARALGQRFVSLDVQPMISRYGLIAPPGAPHKLAPGTGRLTGWRRLTTPLETALRIARNPCGSHVWNGLVQELTHEYQAVRPTGPARTADDADLELLPHDDAGAPWLPLIGGRSSLPADLANAAATGTYAGDQYGSDASRLRQAILASLAARGWRLEEVLDQIRSGRWRGIADLYIGRRREAGRMARLIPAEWRKAIRKVAGENPGRNSHTREINTRPPGQAVVTAGAAAKWSEDLKSRTPVHSKDDLTGYVLSDFQSIRVWQNALYVAERDPAEARSWGRKAMSIRRVLRALGQASQLKGTTTTGFGVRSLSLASGLSYTTVASVLRRLRDEDDPWVSHERLHHLEEADYYMIRVPDRYREAAIWRRWQAGTFDAIHPVFRRLPAPAAFVFEALTTEPVQAGDVQRAAAVSSSATTESLQELATVGLAQRVRGEGWRRGPTDLDTAARILGADIDHAELESAYAEDRRIWHELLSSADASRQPWQPPANWTEIPATDPGPEYGAPIDVLAQDEPPDQDEERIEDLIDEDEGGGTPAASQERLSGPSAHDLEILGEVLGSGPSPFLARKYNLGRRRARRQRSARGAASSASTRRALGILRAVLGDSITIVDDHASAPAERPPPAAP